MVAEKKSVFQAGFDNQLDVTVVEAVGLGFCHMETALQCIKNVTFVVMGAVQKARRQEFKTNLLFVLIDVFDTALGAPTDVVVFVQLG